MKVAIIGSRGLFVENFDSYLPKAVTEIVTGGAKGIDSCAMNYALTHHIKLTTFLPDYRRFGRGAPLKRNLEIINYADFLLAFWDGSSKGTRFVIEECGRRNLPIGVYVYEEGRWICHATP